VAVEGPELPAEVRSQVDLLVSQPDGVTALLHALLD
jgi:hypothetical protein